MRTFARKTRPMNSAFSETVISWYLRNRRELPWRETKDPYRIWVSEIILQQTRVVQGYDYFLRFTERFPTVDDLALADEDEVLKLWQGLGYYSRARNLHEAARAIHAMGRFPDTYKEVRALKGVGDYTAAAICSFAYGLPCAVVDGNVYRVLARWQGIDVPIDSTEGKKLFAQLAQELIDVNRPALYNQAIMDFGALQCVPSSPCCMECPLAETCMARAEGRVAELPVKRHKTKVRQRYFNYVFVHSPSCAYIAKRTDANDIWQGLYQLPLVECEADLDEAAFYASDSLRRLWGGAVMPLSIRCVKRGVKHVLSHQVLLTNFYEAEVGEEAVALPGYSRVPLDELERYAVPRLVHQFLKEQGCVDS